jgi:hypothetical protein
MKIYYFLTFVAATVLLACGQAHAGVNFNDFSSTAGLTLNGNAAGNVNNGIDPNPVLRLASAQTGQKGSAFTTLVENIATFNFAFQFRITNAGGSHDGTDTGADGITFTIQGVGDTALGGGGGGFGYLGIGSSVAVEFDTWNNWAAANDLDSNHLGIDTNGGFGGATLAVAPRFDDGNLWYAWIDYDGTTLEVRVNQTGVRPAAADLSRVIDIPTTIGGPTTAYVGFTGATGGAFGDHDIISWNFNHNPVAVCQGAVVAVGEVPNINGGSYDPDGNPITLSQSPSGAFDEAGIYDVTLTVTDSHGASDSCTAMVVVYDPSAGFVTGGGWIDSPASAYKPDNTLVGKANFGFVSKYKKGADTPTGNTEFVFHAADFNFHSDSYEWLVVAGAKAMFKGVGTVNGGANYGFMLSAIDAALTPSTPVDRFRIKIWDKDYGDVVIYDNQFGADEDADPTTAIGGGSIIVHKGKN